jgi:hypothetical protein
MVLFPVNAHYVDTCTPISSNCVVGERYCSSSLYQDRSCVRQGLAVKIPLPQLRELNTGK